jgi:hypothetical protein
MKVRVTLKISMAAAALAAVSLTQPLMAIPLIDTTSALIGSTIYPFGETQSSTYGQTFTVTGTETRLDSFSFRLNDYDPNPSTVSFNAYVYAWDGTKSAGPQLFASGALSTTHNGGLEGYEQFLIGTGGLELVSGQQYVAFFNASGFFHDGIVNSVSTWELTSQDAYTGGQFVYDLTGDDFGSLMTGAWTCSALSCPFDMRGRDTWFRANFSTVPEPSTFMLTLAGAAVLGLARRRRTIATSDR